VFADIVMEQSKTVGRLVLFQRLEIHFIIVPLVLLEE